METIQVGGTEICFDRCGEGTPILFIHPPGMGRAVFWMQKLLCSQFQIITLDLSGHGDSGTRGQAVTLESYIEEVLLVLDYLGHEQAVICGYSAGGAVSQKFVLTHPKRTKALIMSGGFPAVSTSLLRLVHRGGIKLLPKYNMLLAQGIALAHTKDYEFQRQLRIHMNKANPLVWQQYYKLSYRFDCRRQLSSIECPVLLLYGSKSDYINKHLQTYRNAITRLQYHIVENEWHQLPTRRWKEFNEVIGMFVEGL